MYLSIYVGILWEVRVVLHEARSYCVITFPKQFAIEIKKIYAMILH